MSWLRLFTSLSLLQTSGNVTAPLGENITDIMSSSAEVNQQYFK